MKYKKILLTSLKNLIAWILSLIVLAPLVLVILNSLKTKAEANSMSMSLPQNFNWENYLVVIKKGKLLQSLFNSMFYASATAFIGIIVSSMAAFVLARNKTRINKVIYYIIVMGIALPLNFVALMGVMQFTHLVNSRLGLCLLYNSLQIPFSVFLIYGFISTIPIEIDEAAVIDGCNSLKLFFIIVAPLLKPVIVTVMILNFIGAWNEFVLPLYYLNSADKWPMTLAVYNFFGQYEMEWNLVSADIVLTSLPVFIIYAIGQKYIVSGMTAGAVKG